jgi:methyl-accepting chemotaxis protein
MFSNIRNLKLSYKFAAAFGVICILTVLQGIAALIGLYRIDSVSTDLTTRTHAALEQTSEMRQEMQAARRMELAMLLCADQKCADAYIARRNTELEKYGTVKEHFLSLQMSEEFRNEFRVADETFLQYKSGSDSIISAFNQQLHKDPTGLGTQEQQLLVQFNQAANRMDHIGHQFADASRDNSELLKRTNSAMRRAVAFVMVLVTLLGVMTGVLLTRMIVRPVEEMTAALESLADKNLTVQVDSQTKDEIGRLASALNTSVSSMRQVLIAVLKGADQLALTSQEISGNSIQASANAQHQSQNTQQIAVAAQEMTATISEISHNAEAAAVASQDSARKAEEGGKVMQSAESTMGKISRVTATVSEKMNSLALHSEEIGKVASVIGEISEQTNLLALNAAIEAARAGEHGRGFSVVAGEVRRLAERTKEATEEISATIKRIQNGTAETLSVMEESRAAVGTGLEETIRARLSLESIIDSSRQVGRQIGLIATAATEQTAASGEISESAAEISQWTTENARGADLAVVSTKNLVGLANDLDSMIRQFRL